jgi:RND family efflux transporter MFP subunit
MSRFGRLSTILVLGGIVLAAAIWWFFGRSVEITAIAPFRGTAAEIVYATGAVEPVRWAKVTSLVRDRIVEICDCEGKEVKKGDVLVRLDDREVNAQLGELKAREEFIKREVSRVTELIARNAATTQAFERARMELQQVQALIMVQLQKIDDYTIVAPMDGVVLRRDGQVGEITDVGQVLVRVGVPKPLQVVAEVNEEDIPRVAVGQVVLFRTDAFPERRLEGKIREITPMGDVIAKTYRIKIDLPDNTPLKPGMSVEANVITREQANALLLPTEAIERNSVYVVKNDMLEKRAVKVGIRGTRNAEILSGLDERDLVAAPARPEFTTGLRVRATVRPPQ